MGEHIAYWTQQMEQGRVVAFGPVAGTKGSYGIAILELPDDLNINSLTDADPVIVGNIGMRYEIHPMPRGAVHR